MRELLTFDDVLIMPKYSTVDSRRNVTLASNIFGNSFDLPIVSSNMETVTEVSMARRISELGGLALLHRFCSVQENVRMYEQSVVNNDCYYRIGASIGISNEERERAEALINVGCNIICIDVAHGAQARAAAQVEYLRDNFEHVNIILGNFGSLGSVEGTLENFTSSIYYPDAIKVGIGPGAACTTRIKTGIGVPQFSAVQECAKAGIPVIADGGCRKPADICKALAAGASMVMLGFMLAGTEESPGRVINGQKTYAGSAAGGYAQGWKTSEGAVMQIPYKGSVVDILMDIEGGIRSSMSYVNARNIKEFQENAEFVKVTNATRIENGPVAQ